MITIDNILETNRMITENKLDVRTITMGISLRDCAHPNIENFCRNVYDKITKSAEFLVKTGEDIEAQYGIPIIHKRISVTPIAIAAEACKTDSYVPVAEALDKAAKEVGVNFIGGFSALVEKGFTNGDKILINSIHRLWLLLMWFAPLLIWVLPRLVLTWTACVRWVKSLRELQS